MASRIGSVPSIPSQMGSNLHPHSRGPHLVQPPLQFRSSKIGASPLQCLPYDRVRPEQHHKVTMAGIGGDQVRGRRGFAPLPREVHRRHQPTQGSPSATTAASQHYCTRVRLPDRFTTPGRSAPRPRSGAATDTTDAVALQGEVDAEDHADTAVACCLGEAHRAVQTITIGEGQRALAVLYRPTDKLLRGGDAMAQ